MNTYLSVRREKLNHVGRILRGYCNKKNSLSKTLNSRARRVATQLIMAVKIIAISEI
jgi:hypothetical protein